MPATISSEAAAAIAAMEAKVVGPVDLPAPEDQAGWDDLFGRQEAAVAALNARTLERYGPGIRVRQVAGVDVVVVTPVGASATGPRIIYLHGGGYAFFSAHSSLFASVPLAHDLGLELWSIDYPRAPRSKADTTVPCVTRVLAALLADAVDGLLVGDSAGGGLALAATLALATAGPKPRALALWSPWCDVTAAGASHRWLAAADPVLRYPGNLERAALAYAPSQRHGDPDVSPIHARYDATFPPTLIQCGVREILLSDSLRLYRRLDEAGCPVYLDVHEGMPHSFQAIAPELPESVWARRKMSRFFDAAVRIALR